MPRIEQLQLVHWGSLRPDPIELDPRGINVATGGNGTGKTSLLDAVKLILGVEQLKQKPAEYIFDGRGDPARRAERSYIKVVFQNPIRSPRRGRIFADAGRGCEDSERVTAICEVTRDGRRRYMILSGAIAWARPTAISRTNYAASTNGPTPTGFDHANGLSCSPGPASHALCLVSYPSNKERPTRQSTVLLRTSPVACWS